jgi:hypothetical protein
LLVSVLLDEGGPSGALLAILMRWADDRNERVAGDDILTLKTFATTSKQSLSSALNFAKCLTPRKLIHRLRSAAPTPYLTKLY